MKGNGVAQIINDKGGHSVDMIVVNESIVKECSCPRESSVVHEAGEQSSGHGEGVDND